MLKMIKYYFRKIGIDFSPFKYWCNHEARFKRLLDFYEVNVIVDVGANIGQYGRKLRNLGYKKRIVSLEPIKKVYEELLITSKHDSRWDAYNFGISENDGQTFLNISENFESSSILNILPRSIEYCNSSNFVNIEQIDVMSLESILNEFVPQNSRLFLKLDVQGLEGFVLDWNKSILKKFVGIQLEASIIPLYENEANYLELFNILADYNFVLMAIEPAFSDKLSGKIIQLDAVFFREN